MGCGPETRRSDRQPLRQMRDSNPIARTEAVAIDIGGMVIALRTRDSSFRQLLQNRYSGFVAASRHPQFEFDIELSEPSQDQGADEDVEVRLLGNEWMLQRG